MAESIKGLVEHVEEEFGSSIVARDESLVVLASQPGLGPPDLVWLQKVSRATLTASSSEPRGFYHHQLGRDVSSSASVAAYFAELTSRVEPISFLQVGIDRGGGAAGPDGAHRTPGRGGSTFSHDDLAGPLVFALHTCCDRQRRRRLTRI